MVKTMQQAQYEEQIEVLKKSSIVMHCTHWGCPNVVLSFTTCSLHDPNTKGCQTHFVGVEIMCQTDPVIIRPVAVKMVPRKLFDEKPKKKQKIERGLKLCTQCFCALQPCKNIECDKHVCKKCDKECLFCKLKF